MENKWWEYYAVRYFVGTVVGAIIIAYLNSHSCLLKDSLNDFVKFKDSAFLGVGQLAALGFAFCYIASAPVLTLHATRAHIRCSTVKKSPFINIVPLAMSMLVIFVYARSFMPLSAALIFGVVVGSQIGLILAAIISKFRHVEEFYRVLAINRASANSKKDDPATASLEYVTSYRHLREHGNAMTIVVLEGLLAYFLLTLPSLDHAIIVIAIWLLPATTAWLFGTVLESRFVTEPVVGKSENSTTNH